MAWELVDNLQGSGDINSESWNHPGGEVSVAIEGDLGGGTITLVGAADYTEEGGDANATFQNIAAEATPADAQRTTPGYLVFRIGIGCRMRVELTGATDADVNVRKAPSPEKTERA